MTTYYPGSALDILANRVQLVEQMEGGLELWAQGVNTTLQGKANTSHSHVANDISDATTVGKAVLKAADAAAARTAIGAGTSNFSGSYNDLSNKPTIPSITQRAHIADVDTTAPNNAETNAPADAPTNLNPLSTLLGALTGEVNATNNRQNQIATKVNANATKQNAIANILRDCAAKLNLTFDALEPNGILAAS